MDSNSEAYIPYATARKHLVKAVDDLHNIKSVYNELLDKNCAKIQKETEELFRDAYNLLQSQYKEQIDSVKNTLSSTAQIIIKSQNSKDSIWCSKAKNLKEQNIKLMSEVNQLIEYNLNFKKQSDSEKEKELHSVKSSHNKSLNELLDSLKKRENSLKAQYENHLGSVKQFNFDKLSRIEEQNSVNRTDLIVSLNEEHQMELQVERQTTSDNFAQELKKLKEFYENKLEELSLSSEKELQSRIKSTKGAFQEQIMKLESNYQDKVDTIKIEHENFLGNYQDELSNTKANAELELKKVGKLSSKRLEDLSREKDCEISRLTSRFTDIEQELSQTADSFKQFKSQSILEKETLMKEQDNEIKTLGLRLNSIEEERDDLRHEWKKEKTEIEISYNQKIKQLEIQISENEAAIKKHEEAASDVKINLEKDMKAFEVKKQEELAKIVQANDEEKQILVKKLENLTSETELSIRTSLRKMQFHKAEQEKLENTNDMLEKEKQVIDEEKDVAQAESHVEIQEKMQITLSQRELTIAELKTVKSNRKSIETDLQKSCGVVTVGLGSISRENIAPVVIKDQESITSEEKQTEATIQGENTERYKEKEEGKVLDLIKSNEEQKPVSHLESDTENDRTRLKAEITHLNTQKTSLEKKLEQEVKEKKEVASLNIKLMSEVHSAQVNMVIKDEKIKSQDKAITMLENEIAVKEEVVRKLKEEIADLEGERHSLFDLDSRNEIQKYQDKLMLAEQGLEITERTQKRKLEEVEDVNVKLESSVARTQNELSDLQNQLIQTKEHHAQETNQIIRERDRAIAALEIKLEELTSLQRDSELQSELEETQYLLDVKDRMLEEKNKQIKEVEKEMAALQSELTQLNESSPISARGAATRGSARVAARAGPRGALNSSRGAVSNQRGAASNQRGAANNPRAQRLLETQISTLKSKNESLSEKLTGMEQEIVEHKRNLRNAEAEARKTKDLAGANKDAKKYEMTKKTLDETRTKLDQITSTVQTLEKDNKSMNEELASLVRDKKKLEAECGDSLGMKEQVSELSDKVKHLQSENWELVENYNSERILRKKYFNQMEDMKGKIRVFCRARPISNSEMKRGNFNVVLSPDEYTLSVETKRGTRDFSFDQVFTPETRGDQEHVFEDVKMLVQSAVDGYNVCIFAYGQTGSGKTFTMIGTDAFPGVAPRAFDEIFELLESNVKKSSFSATLYMCELYNDMLIDLMDKGNDKKLDIKKDKKGMIFVQNISVKTVSSSEDLMKKFTFGSSNRHVASTKMNAESSRSHLVISVVIETTNKATGAVLRGKLSLVDLAGSERAAKTEATAEQLKEAQSINKSLSALGDVISALSSDASYVPYRNNKLTMLMQDSLGGNAKTLMFVNISPVDYNTDETVVSLTYASRVKLITNSASKNAESKEISRLKDIIAKLKKGGVAEAEEEAEEDT